MKVQRGFTLLELMVAMAIFAMLAVAGWQVFDGVSRARDQAQRHADNLAVLQQAYLQLQQDMGQIIPYQAAAEQSTDNSNSANNNNTINSNTDANSNDADAAKPFMTLDAEHISFIRFADPDPRYQTSPSLQRIEYIFTDQRLIRRQYTSVQAGPDSTSLDSVLLDGVSAGRWQAYLPELSAKFPNADNQSAANNQSQLNEADAKLPETLLLPKGVAINFTYQDVPITWQWALTSQAVNNDSPANPATDQ